MGYGLALRELYALCAGAGLRVIAMAALVGEHSFSAGRVRLAPGRPDAGDLAAAEGFGRELAVRLDASSGAGECPGAPAIEGSSIPGGLELMARVLPKDSARIFARVPRTNPSCTGCGACVAFCPMGAIGRNLDIDGSKCIRCFACAKRCPRGGRNIGFNAGHLVAGVTRMKGGSRRENLYLLPEGGKGERA
jgi:ferredoxin